MRMKLMVEKTIDAIVNRANEIYDDPEYGTHITIHLERLADVLRKMEKVKEDSEEKRGDGEVRKDGEWLKEEINSIWHSGHPILGEVVEHDRLIELIDQLDEPEITEEQAWKVIELENSYHLAPAHTKVYKEAIQNGVKPECFNEPQKPVIPQFVADWIEECKEVKHNLYGVLDFAPTDVEEWLFHTPEKSERVDLIARAWLYGYEVEKEKLYTVDLPPFYELIKRLDRNTYELKRYSDSGLGDYTNAFTEQEIKDYDKRFWAFAQEVTECTNQLT